MERLFYFQSESLLLYTVIIIYYSTSLLIMEQSLEIAVFRINHLERG